VPVGTCATTRCPIGSESSLRVDRLRWCGVYADAVTHDGRLCLANVRAAADAGATVVNYADVRGLRTERGRVAGADVQVDGSLVPVSARAVVTATGPWVDELRRLEDPAAAPTVRLSKGSHVLLRLDEPWSAALTIPHDDARVSFAVPWQGMLLLGTTDTLYERAPDGVEATEAEIAQILDEAAVAVDSDLLRPERIRSVFAGLRVLPFGNGATASARRETVIHRGSAGMLSVAGGKLTTYRRIALDALGDLRSELGLRRLGGPPLALPGAADPDDVALRLARRWPELEPSVHRHLAHLYAAWPRMCSPLPPRIRTSFVHCTRRDRTSSLRPCTPATRSGPAGHKTSFAAGRRWAFAVS
jgi:glycerol-3-phosphate dehydrogenase